MQVTMLVQIQGFRDGDAWPAPGGTIDVPDHEAADLIAARYAKEATGADTTDEHDAGPATHSDAEPAGDGDEDADGSVVGDATKLKGRRRK